MKTTLNIHAADSAAVAVATVTNKALTTNVVTLTTAADHGLVTGDRVIVAISDATFDGPFVVASTPSTTTFTYAKTHANVTSAAATGSVSRVPTFTRLGVNAGRNGQKVMLQNKGTGTVSYDFTQPTEGLSASATGFSLASGSSVTLEFGGDLWLSTDADSTDLRYAVVS